MAGRETWAKRVAEWKASGLTSTAYCEGKPFTAGGLRHMAHRLGRGQRRKLAPVRVARVVRISELRAPRLDEERSVGGAPALVVEIGTARVVIRPGVDRATLAAVVEALSAAAVSERPAR
jgi:hypothetical protein